MTILSPSEGDLLEPGEEVTLKGTATDPDAGALTGTWSVKTGGTTKPIGQGNTLQLKPAGYVGPGCGNVDATLDVQRHRLGRHVERPGRGGGSLPGLLTTRLLGVAPRRRRGGRPAAPRGDLTEPRAGEPRIECP